MAATKTGYIESPVYDWIFIILSPVWACLVGVLLAHALAAGYPGTVQWWGNSASLPALLSLTQAHLIVVFFRSHGNPNVFSHFRLRFLLVPPLLFVTFLVSRTAAEIGLFFATWWDVYHTSQQNFGLARVYDAKSGQGLPKERMFEKMFHLVTYLCPILAGPYLLAHFSTFEHLEQAGLPQFGAAVVRFVATHADVIRNRAILAMGAVLFIALIVDSKRMHDGYRYPLPKVALIASTLFCSVFAWGFRSFGDAFFVVNLYHAVQYFAFVWATEKRQPGSMLQVMASAVGLAAAFCLFFIPPLLLGSWFEFGKWHGPTLALLLTCALLHFWYDGFIWSVRKQTV